MCLVLLAWKADPSSGRGRGGRDLVVAANRDEFYDRPTAPAGFWDVDDNNGKSNNSSSSDGGSILAGRDLRSGGTALAVSRHSGRFAAVTNVRDATAAAADDTNKPDVAAPTMTSRGHLVTDFVRSMEDPADYFNGVSTRADNYRGFNLIVADHGTCWYYSNVGGIPPRRLEPGIYGLCNHRILDPDWPKVVRGKAALQAYLKSSNDDGGGSNSNNHREGLFRALADRRVAQDDDLPCAVTGCDAVMERALSPLFVRTTLRGAPYGTRSSTVVERWPGTAEDSGGERSQRMTTTITYCERRYDPSGRAEDTLEFSFQAEEEKR